MVIVYSTERKVRALPEEFIESLLNPATILRGADFIEHVEALGRSRYSITFRWRKFGITKTFNVVFRVYRDGNTVVYESTPDSPHKAKLVFTIVRVPDEEVIEVNVYSEFEGAGKLAEWFGKGDFGRLIEQIVDHSIKEHLKRMVEEPQVKPDCRSCIFYEAARSYCYALETRVTNPEEPPCAGARFKPVKPAQKSGMMEREGESGEGKEESSVREESSGEENGSEKPTSS